MYVSRIYTILSFVWRFKHGINQIYSLFTFLRRQLEYPMLKYVLSIHIKLQHIGSFGNERLFNLKGKKLQPSSTGAYKESRFVFSDIPTNCLS